MLLMTRQVVAIGALIPILLAASRTLHAQPAAGSPWSLEVSVGWDNGVSGNINSSGIGTLNDQVVVITPNSFEDVYGTGLHLRFGAAYALNDVTEVIGHFTFQSLDADQVAPMGDIGVSNLYGQYTDYQTFGLDVGLRRYVPLTTAIRAYGEGTVGLGFVDKTDITLVAPGANLSRDANDFYDQTAAFALGANVGLSFQTGGRIDFFGQLGLRWMSGMAQVDDLGGTGLAEINNKSSRWTLPLGGGIRFRF
jgi:opacity protein-like surface antigen